MDDTLPFDAVSAADNMTSRIKKQVESNYLLIAGALILAAIVIVFIFKHKKEGVCSFLPSFGSKEIENVDNSEHFKHFAILDGADITGLLKTSDYSKLSIVLNGMEEYDNLVKSPNKELTNFSIAKMASAVKALKDPLVQRPIIQQPMQVPQPKIQMQQQRVQPMRQQKVQQPIPVQTATIVTTSIPLKQEKDNIAEVNEEVPKISEVKDDDDNATVISDTVTSLKFEVEED